MPITNMMSVDLEDYYCDLPFSEWPKYESRIMLPLSLSYDHRVIDGAEGARFCAHLRESLGKDFAYKLAI